MLIQNLMCMVTLAAVPAIQWRGHPACDSLNLSIAMNDGTAVAQTVSLEFGDSSDPFPITGRPPVATDEIVCISEDRFTDVHE